MMKRGRGRRRKMDIGIGSPNSNLNEDVPYSDKLPEFFKLYTPALSSTVIRIPPDFIDKLGGSFPTTCTLKMPLGSSSRQVSANRVNDDWFFQEGWPEFVEENSLQDRDFLTFCYVGKSTFLVKIFSWNCCPKVASHTSRIDRIDHETHDSESEKSEIVQTKWLRNTRRGDTDFLKDGKPCFTIKVTKGYVKRAAMRLPMDFWSKHMRRNEKSRKATLWVGNDEWSVDLGIYSDRVLFLKGILQFMKDNSIKVGASCTFQLIDFNTFSFKVTFTNASS